MFKQLNRFLRSTTGLATIAGLVLLLVAVAFLGDYLEWWNIIGEPGTAGLPPASYPAPAGGYTCLPTCSETDAKFLLISNSGMATFSGAKIVAWISVPGDQASFDLSIFDGDSGKDNAGNLNWKGGNWDEMHNEATYTLYADPLKDNAGNMVVGTWYGNQDPMPNNGWFNVTINNVPEAKAPSQHYFYRLEVTQAIESKGGNAFKLRSTGYLSTGRSDLVDASIAVVGQWATPNDTSILYPQFQGNYNNLGESTYTGDWQFYFFVPTDQSTMELWDGDFDRGTSSSAAPDTDDLNTEGKPAWASSYAVNERAGGRGAPADDAAYVGYRRDPPVRFELIDPLGQPIYTNEEPSGTEEWENYIMSTDPNVMADMAVSEIKEGFYTLHIQGLDVHNLVFIRLNYEILPICGDQPCPPPCVWPGCDNTACPRTIGYWKNNVKKVLIDNKTKGVQESRQTLEWGLTNVALASPLYRSGINVAAPAPIETVARLTDQEAHAILQKSAGNSMLNRALQQNLAAWLNLATGKVDANSVVTLNVADGYFEGTIWEALQEAQNIILYGGNLERAKDIGDQINNGLLGEEVSTGSCDADGANPGDYGNTMPPDKQPPKHKDMPKAPKPADPPNPVPPPPPDPNTCGARVNNYTVENPTNNPFYGVKFEYASGVEVKDGDWDVFNIVLPADVVAGMTSVNLEAKAGQDVGQVVLEGIDFTSPVAMGEPVKDAGNFFAFYFMGAADNGDGTYTLSFQVQVFSIHGLSHATIGLPDGVVPTTPTGSYDSQVCP
jgi:hypothetical protein